MCSSQTATMRQPAEQLSQCEYLGSTFSHPNPANPITNPKTGDLSTIYVASR